MCMDASSCYPNWFSHLACTNNCMYLNLGPSPKQAEIEAMKRDMSKSDMWESEGLSVVFKVSLDWLGAKLNTRYECYDFLWNISYYT